MSICFRHKLSMSTKEVSGMSVIDAYEYFHKYLALNNLRLIFSTPNQNSIVHLRVIKCDSKLGLTFFCPTEPTDRRLKIYNDEFPICSGAFTDSTNLSNETFLKKHFGQESETYCILERDITENYSKIIARGTIRLRYNKK